MINAAATGRRLSGVRLAAHHPLSHSNPVHLLFFHIKLCDNFLLHLIYSKYYDQPRCFISKRVNNIHHALSFTFSLVYVSIVTTGEKYS